jgi:hypothetical protein
MDGEDGRQPFAERTGFLEAADLWQNSCGVKTLDQIYQQRFRASHGHTGDHEQRTERLAMRLH